MLVVKNLPASAGDIRGVASTPGSGRSLSGGLATHSTVSCLENQSHGQRSLAATDHGLAESDMIEWLLNHLKSTKQI